MKLIKTIFAFLVGLALFYSPVSAETCIDNDGPYINGYCDHWGNHIPGYISNDSWMIGMPTYVIGKMVFYGPQAMDATAEYRGIDYDEMGCPFGGISLMSPIDIGQLAYLKINDIWYGPFCTVDCARRGDMYSVVVIRDEVVEVNYKFAERLGMVTTLSDGTYAVNKWSISNVEVYIPPRSRPGIKFPTTEPIDFSEYWLERIEYVYHEEPTVIPIEGGWKTYGLDEYWYPNKRHYVFWLNFNKITIR